MGKNLLEESIEMHPKKKKKKKKKNSQAMISNQPQCSIVAENRNLPNSTHLKEMSDPGRWLWVNFSASSFYENI